MADNGFITRRRGRGALPRAARRCKPASAATRTRREPYFFDYVEEQLIEEYGVGVYRARRAEDPHDDRPRAAGGRPRGDQRRSSPYSTDPSLGDRLDRPAQRATSGRWPRAAPTRTAASTSPRRATASRARRSRRSCSTTAIRQGIDPNSTTYTSKPLDLDVPGYGPWEVKTYGDSYGGTMNLVQATLASDNTVYAQLDIDLGPEERARDGEDDGHQDASSTASRPRASAACASASRRSRWPTPTRRSPSAASATSRSRSRRSTSPTARPTSLGKPKRKRVFADGVAYEVTKILEQNVQGGTGTAAQHRLPGGRQDRAPPTTSTTPGSSATRPTSRRRSGSATRTRWSRCAACTGSASPAAPSRRRSGTTS